MNKDCKQAIADLSAQAANASLKPLMSPDTRVMLQIFILEIEIKPENKVTEISYGWCIVSSRKDVFDKATSGSPFKLWDKNGVKSSISKVNIYTTSQIALNVVTHLISGDSLKDSLSKEKIESSGVAIDVYLPDADSGQVVIRPIIFNESNSPISRNLYEAFELKSPFKNVPSHSLIVVSLDKLTTYIQNEVYIDNWKGILLKVLKYLQDETTLPFLASGCARYKNIEFINSQCSNEFEVHNTWFENIKEEQSVDIRTDHIPSKRVIVTIEDNDHTRGKNLLVNCFVTNGGQIALDEVKVALHVSGIPLQVEFHSPEPLGQIVVSIWLETGGGYRIWYKNSVVLVRSTQLTIGMVGTSGVVKSGWLSAIEAVNKKVVPQVRDAEIITRTANTVSGIETYHTDPWAKLDREFSQLIQNLNPAKSEGFFFSHGWNPETGEHGALSFLEWFRKIADSAQRILIQDPFFGSVGLDFLARISNTGVRIDILTCTQISSQDDKSTRNPGAEPVRAIELKTFIKSNPSLFDSLRLNIYDIRSSRGGDNNVIHDRYILIIKKDAPQSGFHLSNSIQGATKFHPLLVTPIPPDVLTHVDEYLTNIIEGTKDFQIIELYSHQNRTSSSKEINEVDSLKNNPLYKAMEQKFRSETEIDFSYLEVLMHSPVNADATNFANFWSVFGHFLANNTFSDKIVDHLKKILTAEDASRLRLYLQNTLANKYPIGFNERKAEYNHYALKCLQRQPFASVLEEGKYHANNPIFVQGYGHWGAFYGCDLLLEFSLDEFTTLIEFLHEQIGLLSGKDPTNSSLLKLSWICLGCITNRMIHYADLALITKGLQSQNTIIRGIAVIGLIGSTVDNNPTLTIQQFNSLVAQLSWEERLEVYQCAIAEMRFRKSNIASIEDDLFERVCLEFRGRYTLDRVIMFLKSLLHQGYPLLEKKVTDGILVNLVNENSMPADDVFTLWSELFVALVDKPDSWHRDQGILDLTGWAYCICSDLARGAFIEKIRKEFEKCRRDIFRPFTKGSKQWDNAFLKLLMIRAVFSIAVLYDNANESKLKNVTLIKEIIDDIDHLELDWKPSLPYHEIFTFSKQIKDEYIKLAQD